MAQRPDQLFGHTSLSYSLGLPVRVELTLATLPRLSGGGPGVSPDRMPTALLDIL